MDGVFVPNLSFGPPVLQYVAKGCTKALDVHLMVVNPMNYLDAVKALGAKVIPEFRRDNTDRNRTSPFAFTGNKFEFRMLGSNDSVACPNIMLNTIVAEQFAQFVEQLESGKKPMEIVRDTIKNHKRIIFNGNNYSEEWVLEAEKRGLLNLKDT